VSREELELDVNGEAEYTKELMKKMGRDTDKDIKITRPKVKKKTAWERAVGALRGITRRN
jgi:hypothetical protein